MRPLALTFLLAACASAGTTFTPLSPSPTRGQLLELLIDGLPSAEHPCTTKVDAEVTTPSGKSLAVPAFWMVPHEPVQPPDEPRTVSHVRIFCPAKDWRKGDRVEFLVTDLALVDRETGDRVAVDAFDGPLRWKSQDTALSSATHGGRRGMRVVVPVGANPWPGCSLDLGGADWSRFGELRLSIAPLRGLEKSVPRIEFWLTSKRKCIAAIDAGEGGEPGTWREFVWKLPSTRRAAEWKATGKPQWRIRLQPQEAGDYRIRVNDASRTVRVADGPTEGYLRAAKDDARYLAFDSGKAWFPVGTNLLGRDLDTYRYYLDRLAAQGGNFIRIWLSPRTMGFDTKDGGPHAYDQGKAAQLDALLDLCAAKGVYVMACVSDFREVCSFHESSDWANSPYNAVNGGPCAKPEEFFTSPEAKAQYQAKLRYLVARHGHSPHVQSWEFFNEVNITDGWRKVPNAVRAWHAEMAAYLRSIDPQRHTITSSFAGIEDDPLWDQPLMEIVQRHQYIDGEQSFPRLVSEAHAALRGHGKPVLMGEFGRRKNFHASLDREGVSLHNGMWAAVHSGGCGTAMTWWWQWVDEYGIWPRFGAMARYVEGVDWPREGFRVVPGGTVTAEPDPEHGFGAIAFAPTQGGWKPAPFNTPVEAAVRPDGTLESAKPLPRIVHGVGAHKALHNPVTFRVAFARPTRFAVVVGDVSGYSGAALELRLDGTVALQKDFPDTHPDDTKSLTEYAGAYSIDVPAGQHTVTVENTGRDWLMVRRYEFGAGRPTPAVRVFSLQGRRTVLVWLWNESHTWYRPVYNTTLIRLRNVRVTLSGLSPGRYRCRPFDPWKGTWTAGVEVQSLHGDGLTVVSGEWATRSLITVAHDGVATLPATDVRRDMAIRLERIP